MKVKVQSYYMIETESACFGGYESYEEAQKFARIEKKQHPTDIVKILHETTISTELEEVEQEPCEDCINREDAVKAMHSLVNRYESERLYIDGVVQELENLPSVKPVAVIAEVRFDEDKLQEIVNEKVQEIAKQLEQSERPRGKWIKTRIVPDAYAMCENCGYEIYSENEETDFCPMCGAKMESDG